MKFLVALYAVLSKLFPYQMGRIKERTLSEIVVLEADKLSYIGDFTQGDLDLATTDKLTEDQHFSVGGHAFEIAKIPVVDGVLIFAQAEWVNYLDSAMFSEAEITQLRQLFGSSAKLQFHYGESDRKVPMGTETSRYLASEPVLGDIGSYHRFTPSFIFYNMNGSFKNKMVLTLPEGSSTDKFAGTENYKLAVRISKKGFDTTDVCVSHDPLYSVPQGCDETCDCGHTTTQSAVTHTPKMVKNETKDFGILI